MNISKSLKVWIVILFALALFLPGIYTADKLLSPAARANAVPAGVYDATAAREAAIVYPKYVALARPQVYDATGVREAAIVYAHELARSRPIVYDATGVMLAAINPKPATKPALAPIVYDATGVMLAAINPKPVARLPLSGPVYDATGAMLAAVVFPVYP